MKISGVTEPWIFSLRQSWRHWCKSDIWNNIFICRPNRNYQRDRPIFRGILKLNSALLHFTQRLIIKYLDAGGIGADMGWQRTEIRWMLINDSMDESDGTCRAWWQWAPGATDSVKYRTLFDEFNRIRTIITDHISWWQVNAVKQHGRIVFCYITWWSAWLLWKYGIGKEDRGMVQLDIFNHTII